MSHHQRMPPIRSLHHFAWRCRDAEETRHFYEDLLGLPLVYVVRLDNVPSTGEHCPYIHLFFAMTDGSYLAFFDLGDGIKAEPSPNTPAWVNHLALRFTNWGKITPYLSIQNLFNKQPPLAPFSVSASVPGLFYPVPNGGSFDVVGRYFTLGIRGQF